ncbi:hypothetical protein [Streptomyces sp. NPDC020965]|uniref:hypothetical protein n=1 Tax=Streptomyces sp. NPDC020965 TaxID=3365105 RepID=UPI00379AB6EF
MAASAHLLLSALTTPVPGADQVPAPRSSTTRTRPTLGKPSGFGPFLVGSPAHQGAVGPLTSEPPLPDAAPLTSEPPLADTAPLTSEPTAAGFAGGSQSPGV